MHGADRVFGRADSAGELALEGGEFTSQTGAARLEFSLQAFDILQILRVVFCGFLRGFVLPAQFQQLPACGFQLRLELRHIRVTRVGNSRERFAANGAGITDLQTLHDLRDQPLEPSGTQGGLERFF